MLTATASIPRRLVGGSLSFAASMNGTAAAHRRVGANAVDSSHRIWGSRFDGGASWAVYVSAAGTTAADDTTNFITSTKGRRVYCASVGTNEFIKLRLTNISGFTTNAHRMIHLRFFVPQTGNTWLDGAALDGEALFLILVVGSQDEISAKKVQIACNADQVYYNGAGWYEVSFSLNHHTQYVGADLTAAGWPDTPLAIQTVFVALKNGGAAGKQMDVTFDEIWVTDEQTLGAGKGCIVLMLDDAMEKAAASDTDPGHARRWAALLEKYGMRGVFPVAVPFIGTREFVGTSETVDWPVLARFAGAGHELINHDDVPFNGWSEAAVYPRMRVMLDVWYQGAELRGVPNYIRGFRYFIPQGNKCHSAVVAAARRLYDQVVSRRVTAGSTGGAVDGIHNVFPQCWGDFRRWETPYSAAYGAGQLIRTYTDRAVADGGVLALYNHYCYSSGSGNHPNVDDWDGFLSYLRTSGYRVVTLSELFDSILPHELTWTA